MLTSSRDSAIWSDHNRFTCWLEIDLRLLKHWRRRERRPREPPKRSKKTLDPERIEEIEKVCKHDVIAFRDVEEQAGPYDGFIHMGLTSSDVLDTALAMQLTQAVDRIALGLTLDGRRKESRNTRIP